ncbi:MAG: 16S rRNA (uracil(1498)-N(3))-methyltransferase [Anaerolineae bacterium]|nr:16S rRNA (uracil(1498)-N(3))-methyltransferase [Anaerolineae bacterium]
MHRFFIPPAWIRGDHVLLGDEVVHQVRHVLRLRPGARIVVLDDRGVEYEVALVSVENKSARGDIVARRPASGEPSAQVTLCQAVLKKDNFEWVLQKGTEIGVTRFVPLITARTVAAGSDGVSAARQERWARIVREAAEQSRRGALPVVDAPLTFGEALADIATADLSLIAWEEERATSLRDAVAPLRAASDAPHVAVFIGPEGGFTVAEISQAAGRGVVPVTLGARILRAETAATAAALLVLYELGALDSA